jgi:rRNA-processing protein FCF1
MTKQEIIILNELIKQTVKNTVKETIKEELETLNKNNKKDLREVKLLLAKIIKEGVGSAPVTVSTFLEMAEQLQQPKEKRSLNNFQSSLEEALVQKGKQINGGFQYIPKKENLNVAPISGDAMLNAALPSFDAPIPQFTAGGDFSID